MGNNSSHEAFSGSPPTWTQSLPRDAHRLHKKVAPSGAKVLPERIPGQRLRTTENGRNLQMQGTITGRKDCELTTLSPRECNGQPLNGNHSSSMTSLHHPQLPNGCAVHGNNMPYMHSLHSGGRPIKGFASEPDLRESSPSHNFSQQIHPTTHTIISQSPTKGRIKSRKRHKAPLPPLAKQESVFGSHQDEHANSVSSPGSDWLSIASSPTPRDSKSGRRKTGLFRKKNESRKVSYEDEKASELGIPVSDNKKIVLCKTTSSSVVEKKLLNTVKSETSSGDLGLRTRSVDCIQYELRRSPEGLAASVHSLEIIGSIPPEDGKVWSPSDKTPICCSRPDGTRCQVSSESKECKQKSYKDSSKDNREVRCEINQFVPDFKDQEKKQLNPLKVDPYAMFTSALRRTRSVCSSLKDDEDDDGEWERAEQELKIRRQISDNLQKEIIDAARKLRDINVACIQSDTGMISASNAGSVNFHSQESVIASNANKKLNAEDSPPKTFFFGMEPPGTSSSEQNANSGLIKIRKQQEDEVRIDGCKVEYSRHSLTPKEKKASSEKEWNRSLDNRHRRNRAKETHEPTKRTSDGEGKRKVSRELDSFAATFDKTKISQILMEEYCGKEDAGYHSRQNSGSSHLDTEEQSDNDQTITMNLRPTLPRRQLELPRFSPNAAWHALSLEPVSRQRSGHSDSHSSEDLDAVYEDKIYRCTRPTAPPRGSGEKSADSGISGDAGSPGPLNEFEPLNPPDKFKTSSGPLASSSPLHAGRSDGRRVWTPAQDLDDNSLDESGDLPNRTSFPIISSPPKLTSRSNMFPKCKQHLLLDESFDQRTEKNMYKDTFVQVDSWDSRKCSNSSPVNTTDSSRKVKRSASGAMYSKSLDEGCLEFPKAVRPQEEHWRDNWSMSRSIPNSLNTCEELESTSNISGQQNRNKSESRLITELISSGCKGISTSQSRPITPSYLKHATEGHIMYLPEYPSGKLRSETSNIFSDTRDPRLQGNDSPHATRKERSPPSGEENPFGSSSSTKGSNDAPNKKVKKFSFQSTVRMMEKKKLEEKLSRDAEERERQRLEEVAAMQKVEQEFLKKREREKINLKKQLKLFRKQQVKQPQGEAEANKSFSSEDSRQSTKPPEIRSDHKENRLPSPSEPSVHSSSVSPVEEYEQPFSSLPIDLMSRTAPDDGKLESPGLLAGLKKWVKGRRETKTCYGDLASDASSVTVTSCSRQDPDGAPAVTSRRHPEDIRSEVIAAAKQRRGMITPEGEARVDHRAPSRGSDSCFEENSNRSRALSPESQVTTTSPDSSRRSRCSETRPLTQELPEMRQEQRQYREYRSPLKKHPPVIHIPHQKPAKRDTSLVQNYRRDFSIGRVLSPPPKGRYEDRHDQYPGISSVDRRLRRKRSSSADFLEGRVASPPSVAFGPHYPMMASKGGVPVIPMPKYPVIRKHSKIYCPTVIEGVVPYTPAKGYHHVPYQHTSSKILSVT